MGNKASGREKGTTYRVSCEIAADPAEPVANVGRAVLPAKLELQLYCRLGTLDPIHFYGVVPGVRHTHTVDTDKDLGTILYCECALRGGGTATASAVTLVDVTVQACTQRQATTTRFEHAQELRVGKAIAVSVMMQPCHRSTVSDTDSYDYVPFSTVADADSGSAVVDVADVSEEGALPTSEQCAHGVQLGTIAL